MSDETLFAAALALPAAERAAYLNAHCPDPAVRKQVEALLAAADASNPLDRPPPDLDRTNPRPESVGEPTAAVGDRVGPYKLLEKIGEGGMGEVWVADQLEPIKRRVALKLIKPGMDSRSVLGRFEAERQALAVMDHPNIARVLDAGTTPDGRPYFVMELVKGVPITEFADARKLTPKQRLELFVPVCQAIQHAHMKGIIHRDIKPSNVLVALHDETPVPKVIDFGVAKAIGQQLTEKTIYTGFGALVGTPAYMAPEQATFNQLDVDTRADVYALGVLLYELLAGSPPIDKERLKKAALDEVLRMVRDEEPPRPSQRLSTADTRASIAAVRGTEPAKLSALMKGELDWIVMKALEKDRTRRYETANGFAADVQRYLAGEQVQAVPPSLGYRLRKAYRKNKAAVLVTSAFVGLIAGAAVMGAVLAMKATRAEELAIEERNTARQERRNALEAQAQAEAARQATQRKLNAAAVDLALKYCENSPLGMIYLAQRLKTLPPDATELRQFVTLNLFLYAQRMARLVPHKEPLDAVSPDGRVGFRVRSNGEAELVHPITGARVALLHTAANSWTKFLFSPDATSCALVMEDELRVYDLRTFQPVGGCRPNLPAGWGVTISPTFNRAVVWKPTADDDSSKKRAKFMLWNLETNRQLSDLQQVEWGRYDGITPGELCVFSPDGTVLITVGDDKVARVRSADDGRVLHTLAGHIADVRFAAFSADGKSAATGSNAEVIWWRTADWRMDSSPTVQVLKTPWTDDETISSSAWGQARMLADGVLSVSVRRMNDFREGTDEYLYVRGEPTAYPNRRGVASDGQFVIDYENVYSIRPFREWQSADGRRYPAEYAGRLVDNRFLLLHSNKLPYEAPGRLIDMAADRVIGEGYIQVVPCTYPGCGFVAPQEQTTGWERSVLTVVLPAIDADFDPDVLELWAKVLVRGELNPVSGFFESHDEPTWERNRQELLRRAKPVGEFPFPGAFAHDRLYWVRRELAREKNNEVLLNRLLAEEPTVENYLARAEYWGGPFVNKPELALRDRMTADELRVKAGAGMSERDTSTHDVREILGMPDGSRESYALALRWIDTRPPADEWTELRGLALFRLGRHQEALDLLSTDETVRFATPAAVLGIAAVEANPTRTLLIGLCLVKLGRVTEAAARLEQARGEHLLRVPLRDRWGSYNPFPADFYIEAEHTIRSGSKSPEPTK